MGRVDDVIKESYKIYEQIMSDEKEGLTITRPAASHISISVVSLNKIFR